MFSDQKISSSFKNQLGFSLVEILVAVGIMSIMAIAMMTMQSNQVKSNNYLEFQLKRTQLQGTIIGQFLNTPNNCKCLFSGAAEFPAAGIATLSGVSPTQIGRYNFTVPGDCTTATMPAPFVDATGIDSLRTSSIQLQNITNIAGVYSGNLVLNTQFTKEVMGPRDLPISIPVGISVVPGSPGNVVFTGCSNTVIAPANETIMTTKDDVNNGGGAPCCDVCAVGAGADFQKLCWFTTCAGRYCRALGPDYVGGVGQEVNCFANVAWVTCFKK